MTIRMVNLETLKRAKNAIIGNPCAKLAMAKDEEFVETLVFCLNQPPQPSQDASSADELRIEAAHIISSLSYGSQDALKAMLRAGAPQAFLLALSRFHSSDSVALRCASARAIRTLGIAIAEAVGPSQWGLRPEHSEVRNEAKVALDYVFQIDFLDMLLPLLVDTSPQTSTSIAQLIASAVRTPQHRTAVTDWLPLTDRIKEVKGKRGWEKPNLTKLNSPSRQGGWVVRNLAALLRSRDGKLQEAALSALAALAKDNQPIAAALARAPHDREIPTPLSTVLSLTKSRSVNIQLAACLCATHIIRADQQSCALTVLHVLNRMLGSSTTAQATAKACFVLHYLVADNTTLCHTAYEQGSLRKLGHLALTVTPPETRTEWDKEEPESISCLREAALTAIATLCLFENDLRREVTEKLHLLPVIHTSLTHRHVGVRYAACQCVRALSRAVSVVRTSIVDSGVGLAAFALFKKEDEDRRVSSAALAAVCNIVNEFSPLRSVLLDEGLMPRIAQLLTSDDPDIKVNALWAVKNTLRNSSSEMKCNVMTHLGWQGLANLLLDHHTATQEQAWNIVRNLAENGTGVDMVVRELGAERLIDSLIAVLGSSDDDVILQAACVLANLANGQAAQKELIFANRQILACLRACLSDYKMDVRRPAVACVLELTRTDPKRSRREFSEAGITSTLRHICEWTGGVGVSPTGRGQHWNMFIEDDREVVDQARQALSLLEHSGSDPDVV